MRAGARLTFVEAGRRGRSHDGTRRGHGGSSALTGADAREEEDGADRRARLGSERKGGSGCWRTVLGRVLAGPSRPRHLRPSWAGGLAQREKRESGPAVEKNGAGPKVEKRKGREKNSFFSKYIFQSHFQVESEFNSNSSQSQSLQKQMCSSMNVSTCY